MSSEILYDTKEAAFEMKFAEQTLKQSRVSGSLCGVPAPKFIKIGKICSL